MVIYGTDLYFVDSGDRSAGDGVLSKIDLTVSVPTKTNVITGLWNPRELLLKDDSLYYLKANGEIFSVDLTESVLSTTLITNVTGNSSFNTRSTHMAINNDYVYANLLDQGKIVRFPLNDPTLQEDVVTGLFLPGDIDFIGDTMYYSSFINGNGSRLYKFDTSDTNATSVIVENSLPNLSSFSTLGTDIYCLRGNNLTKIDTTDSLPTNDESFIPNYATVGGENLLINGSDIFISVFFEGYGRIHRLLDNSLNIEENKIGEVKIYPNPVNDNIYVNLNNGSHIDNINIYDVTGKMIMMNSYNDLTNLNLKTLKSGIYFIEIKSNNKLITRKIIKK